MKLKINKVEIIIKECNKGGGKEREKERRDKS
jgi:hypothetical protein